MKEINLVTNLHKKTKRNYIERMLNNKVFCMKEAKKYSKVIDSKNYSQPLYKSSSSTPAIELINPNLLSNNLSSPITIELRFITDDVPIALETFKTFYGSFKLDITKRILKTR